MVVVLVSFCSKHNPNTVSFCFGYCATPDAAPEVRKEASTDIVARLGPHPVNSASSAFSDIFHSGFVPNRKLGRKEKR